MSGFRKTLYMGNLRSLFWFLVTILSILSLAVLPLTSAGSQVSVVPPHNQIKIKGCFEIGRHLHTQI